MPDFMDEAKNLASEHSDVVDKGLDQAEQEAENKTGGRFDSEIQGGEQQAEGFLGTDQQGNQN
jgi:MT0933-like antitoxin protein